MCSSNAGLDHTIFGGWNTAAGPPVKLYKQNNDFIYTQRIYIK